MKILRYLSDPSKFKRDFSIMENVGMPLSASNYSKIEKRCTEIISEIDKALSAPIFNDVKFALYNHELNLGRLSKESEGTQGFHGYPDKVVAYLDLEFMRKRLDWFIIRAKSMTYYR